jgi:protein TonB
VSENKFLQSLCALLGAAVLVCAVHVFLLATSAPRLDGESGFTGAKPSTRAEPSAPPAPLEAPEPQISEPVDPVPEIDVDPAPSDVVRHAPPDAAKEPPVRRQFEITSPGDMLVPQSGDPDYFAAAAQPQIVAGDIEAEHYAALSSPEDAVEPVTFGLGDPIEETNLAERALDESPVADFAETVAPELDTASSPELGEAASPEPLKLAALKPRPVRVLEDKTSPVESEADIAAAPPAERAPPLPLRKPRPQVLADTLPPVTIAQPSASPGPSPSANTSVSPSPSPSASTRPGWQPMTLGFGKDKKRAPAPAPAPRAAPAKPDAEKPAAKPRPSLSGAAYRARVWASLARHRPRIGKAGSATVVFTVGPSGALRSARVARSSGNQALDQRALAAVRSAAPFPAPPAGLSASALTYSIQIYFR